MQNKLNFENMALKHKFVVYDFVSYDSVEFLDTNLDTTLPQIKNKLAKLKKVFLTIGTDTLKLQVVKNKNPNSKHKYKLIEDDLKFIVCKENKLPFTLEVLSLNNDSIENYENIISIFKNLNGESNQEISVIETPITKTTPNSVKSSNLMTIGKLTFPKTDNPDILYVYEFGDKHNLTKTELKSVFYKKLEPNFESENFKLTLEQKDKVDKIIYNVLKVKGIYINKDSHAIRSYIKIFHQIKEYNFDIFTKTIMSDKEKSLLLLEEKEMKEELNARHGEVFEFDLPINERLSKCQVD